MGPLCGNLETRNIRSWYTCTSHADLCASVHTYIYVHFWAGTCAEGWEDYGTGSCYLIVSAEEQKLTWPEARDVCAAYSDKSQLLKIQTSVLDLRYFKCITTYPYVY